MNKLYYGLWQELYRFPWPVRLGIEFIAFALLLFWAFKFLGKMGKLLKVKRLLVILVVLFITKVLSLIGRNREWAYRADERVNEWGKKQIDKPFKIEKKAKRIILIGICLIYFLAVLPDLPIRNFLDDSLVEKVSVFKEGLLSWEKTISSGYTNYTPIFPEKETKEEIPAQKIEKQRYIRLRKKGKKKVKIYKKPSSKSKVIKKAQNEKMRYRNEYRKRGKRYWIKVYLVRKKEEGWILSDVIEKKQVNEILGKKM